jgi:hypothetical protein
VTTKTGILLFGGGAAKAKDVVVKIIAKVVKMLR